MIDRSSSPSVAGAVRAVVDIAAPPDAVFHALSDPHELAAWLGGGPASAPRAPSESACDAGVVPGQSWRAPARAPHGVPGSVCGEYLIVDPPRRLESTWRASWDGFAPERVCFELVPVDVGGVPGTRLTVTHTRAVARLDVTAQACLTVHHDWSRRLAGLAAYLSAPAAAFGQPAVTVHAPWRAGVFGDLLTVHHGD
jgi:uncharacterized protein YndB with AHSA1/START domain